MSNPSPRKLQGLYNDRLDELMRLKQLNAELLAAAVYIYAKGYEAGRRAGCREDLPRLKRRRGDGR
jgi:hypothetical protein